MMARTARRIDLPETDAALIQASFDFLPEEMRSRHRFGNDDQAEWAQRRAQLKLIDRQVITTGSRLAAARLREILRPADPAVDASVSAAATDSERLMQQRAELRAQGAALFYFRDEPPAATAEAGDTRQQRLHPRPLPARYFA
jgi:hypothetical protein